MCGSLGADPAGPAYAFPSPSLPGCSPVGCPSLGHPCEAQWQAGPLPLSLGTQHQAGVQGVTCTLWSEVAPGAVLGPSPWPPFSPQLGTESPFHSPDSRVYVKLPVLGSQWK